MVWVKSEYAGELAVVSAWISAIVPWYLSYAPEITRPDSAVLFVRFPFFQVRYIFNEPLAEAVVFSWIYGAAEWDDGANQIAYELWYVGFAIIAVALALSIAMYLRNDRLEELLPVPAVRMMGALLTLSGLVLAASTVLFYTRTIFGEYPIPLGLPILLALGVILLRVDLVEDAEQTSGETATAESGSAPESE